MTLNEYIKEFKPTNIALLMLMKNGKIISMEYNKSEYKDLSPDMLSREVMDTNVEEADDMIEIWVR